MIKLYKKLKSSEFLTFSELLRIKVVVVTIILMIFGLIVLPITILEDFSMDIRIVGPIVFFSTLLITIVMLITNNIRIAMHSTIYAVIMLMVYFMAVSDPFHGLLLIFIALTIMIFYQDIYTYVLYGGITTLYGIYYINVRGLFLTFNSYDEVLNSNLVYQSTLILFYLMYLMYFVISDNMYEKLTLKYMQVNRNIKTYQDFCLKYETEINERNGTKPLYEKVDFQKSVNEIVVFISECLGKKALNMDEVAEFYFFLHKQDINTIKKKEELPKITQNYVHQLEKYLLNYNSEMVGVLLDIAAFMEQGFNNDEDRYEFYLDNMFKSSTSKILALVLIYQFLKKTPLAYDKWGRVEKQYTHSDIFKLLKTKEVREYLSFEDVKFFMDNADIFENYI